MAEVLKKRSEKAGMPAGSLIHIGEKKVKKIKIRLVDYNEKEYVDKIYRKCGSVFSVKGL